MERISSRRWARDRVWLLPFAAVIALGLPRLFGGGYEVDTALYAGVAWRWATQEPPWGWWTPMLGPRPSDAAAPYFNKPPLLLWVHAAWFWTLRPLLELGSGGTGPPMWAVRLPVVLQAAWSAGMAAVAVRALASTRGGRAGGEKVGLVAGLVYALTYAVFIHLDRFILDYAVVGLMMTAVWLAARGEGTGAGGGRWVLLTGVPVGLALLVKPLFAVFAYVPIAAYLLARGRVRLTGLLIPAAGIALVIALPWHLDMARRWGAIFTDQYFGREVISRAAGEIGREKPWWFYFEVIAVRFAPWSLLLAAMLVEVGRRLVRRRVGPPAASSATPGSIFGRSSRLGLFAGIWCVAWLAVLLPFGDPRPRYMMHLWPMMAGLVAIWVVRMGPRPVRGPGSRRLGRLTAVSLVTSLVAGPLAVATGLRVDPERAKWATIGRALEDAEANSPGVLTWTGTLALPRQAEFGLRLGVWPADLRRSVAIGGMDPAAGDVLIWHTDLLPAIEDSLAGIPRWDAGDYSFLRMDAGLAQRLRTRPDPARD